MTDLIGYRVFVTVIEAGSIKSASKQLYMSAPAISKRLAKLEHALQVPLFNRSHKQLTLTASGASFFPQCKKILAEVARVESELLASKNKISGRISITMSKALIRSSVYAAFNAFSDAYPDIKLHIQTTDEVIDLVDEQVDFAFRIGEIKNSNHLVAHHLFNCRLTAVASAEYLRSRQQPKSFEQLNSCKLLMMTAFKTSTALKEFFNQRSIHVTKLAHHMFDDIEGVYQGVKHNLGIGFMLDVSIEKELLNQQFIKVLDQEQLPEKPLFLVYNKSNFESTINTLFKDFIKSYYQGI